MLARLQRAITFSLVAIAALGALAAFAAGHPAWAPLAAALIVGGYLAFMALEFVLMAAVHGADPTPKPTVPQLLRAWWGEVTTSPRVFCWQQPFRADAEPDHTPTGARRRGVVLVHGFVCNRGFWNRWMPRLRAADVPFVAVNLEPVFGALSGYVAAVEHAVARLEAATGVAPVVVGHSMGGLVTRAWLAGTHAARVHHVVTIGTPHGGTWAARFSRSANALDMRVGSPFQQNLIAHEPPPVRARFTCFFSNCDNIVYPPTAATLAGADNRHVPGAAHVHLADHPAVFDAVMDQVTR